MLNSPTSLIYIGEVVMNQQAALGAQTESHVLMPLCVIKQDSGIGEK